MDETRRYDQHQGILDTIHETYIKKNKDYGNSFANSIDNHGMIAAIVRMDDKMERITSINESGEILVKDESVRDTLLDLANYAIMAAMWLDDQDETIKHHADGETYLTIRKPKTPEEWAKNVSETFNRVGNPAQPTETKSIFDKEENPLVPEKKYDHDFINKLIDNDVIKYVDSKNGGTIAKVHLTKYMGAHDLNEREIYSIIDNLEDSKALFMFTKRNRVLIKYIFTEFDGDGKLKPIPEDPKVNKIIDDINSKLARRSDLKD